MIDKIKEILLRNGIVTTEELKEMLKKANDGVKIEELILEKGTISEEELKKIIFNAIYFDKRDIFNIIEENIEDDVKRGKFIEKIAVVGLSEKEKLDSLIINDVISTEDLAIAKAEYYEIEYLKMEEMEFTDKILSYMGYFDKNFIKKNKFLILGEKKDKVIMGVVEPENIIMTEELSFRLKKPIIQKSISKNTFKSLFNLYLNKLNLSEGLGEDLEDDKDEIKVEDLKNEENPIVKLVNNVLLDSVRKGASDIHIEPYGTKIKIKNRIDGVLIEENSNISKSYQNMIISRIKILSNLNIAEHRIPQDGRFKKEIEGRKIDFRVSILPTSFGESVVIRILDRKEGSLSLKILGLDKEERVILTKNGLKPHGLILVTGPTGSGKTTTLYALLSDIKKKEEKFITIEDPIEYQLDDVVQIPVNEKTGLTFAKGLRAVLRQDPDKVMVGEIRDRETAEIAVQAALTGHLVLSTIHANSTVEAIGRLINIGIDPYQFTTALNLIIGQRLMRKICINCSGSGCIKCDYTGYKGRSGVYELLEVSEDIKEMIIAGDSPIKIRDKAVANGMRVISEKAKEKVENNLTNRAEYERIIGEWK